MLADGVASHTPLELIEVCRRGQNIAAVVPALSLHVTPLFFATLLSHTSPRHVYGFRIDAVSQPPLRQSS